MQLSEVKAVITRSFHPIFYNDSAIHPFIFCADAFTTKSIIA